MSGALSARAGLGRALLGACLALLAGAAPARAAYSDWDISSASASLSTTQAGAHPDFTTSFTLAGDPAKTDGNGQPFPWGDLRSVSAELPAGLSGNPQAYPTCDAHVFRESIREFEDESPREQCPRDSQVGLAGPGLFNNWPPGAFREPVYNLEPPGGDVVARLGFFGVFAPIYIDVRIDPARENALTATASNLPSGQADGVTGAFTTIWGVPSDPSHDQERFTPVEAINCFGPCSSEPRPSGLPPTAFMINPTSCGAKEVRQVADSYQGFSAARSASPGEITGCEALPFDPTITLRPTSQLADSASGMDVNLSLPQSQITDPGAVAEAHLKKAVVTLPEGMSLNPSAADGLAACSAAQIGLVSESPIRFDASPPSCPDASKVGTAKITTPLLPQPIDAGLYLADPADNPFHTLLAGYMVAQGQGVLLKVPGRFDLDPATGRITATFDNNPQQPFSELELHFKGGNRGVLVTPPKCGTYQIDSKLSPWSAADPNNPTPAETVSQTTSFDVTSGPGGGPCPDYLDPARFTPGFSAGTTNPQAGAYSPFFLKVTRPDGQQSLKDINATLPLGLTANLNGIPRCPQSQITPGVGGHANCGALSQVGTVSVGAGAGTPFFLKDQPVYLTEGYGGAPFGLAIDTHALAGPFDLGHVVVRSKLNVDPQTAQVSADAETLPWIIKGIPLHIRSVTVTMNRSAFTLNPTSCNPMRVTGTITGGGESFDDPADDTTKAVSDHFQVGGCGALGFSPKLTGAILNGKDGIHRSDHPSLSFHLQGNPGDANIAAVNVTLPKAFQIDQANLGNICSEAQLTANQCAGRNTVGTAVATTPLLDFPLQGPVYAVSGSGGLPRLAVVLNGPPSLPINLLLRGDTFTTETNLNNAFNSVPDAPVTSFDLTINGGDAGYLVNNRNVCSRIKNADKKHKKKKRVKTKLNAQASFTAHNGDTLSQKVPISADCPKKKKGKKSGKGRKG